VINYLKHIVKYLCEICGKDYDTEQKAIDCESLGKQKPLASKGDIVEYLDEWNGGFGAEWEKYTLYQVDDIGHWIIYKLGSKYKGNVYFPDREAFGNDEFIKLCRIKRKDTLKWEF
jgi:hypothetical protein